MFRSRKNRRRDRASSTRPRRLGVERMEGRMMLSATGFEGSLPVSDVNQFTLSPINFNLTGANVLISAPSIDGGYVNSNSSTLVSDSIVRHTSTTWPISLNYGLQSQDINASPLWLGNYLDLSGTDLQPAVIPAWADGSTAETNIQPVVIGPAPSPTVPSISEGGSIPIHAIFADFRKDSHLASGVKSIASLA